MDKDRIDIGTYHTLGYIANDIDNAIKDERAEIDLARARDMIRAAQNIIGKAVDGGNNHG